MRGKQESGLKSLWPPRRRPQRGWDPYRVQERVAENEGEVGEVGTSK